MIGGNDVAGEQFTLADADTVAQLRDRARARRRALLVVRPRRRLPAGSASPTCNSLGNAGTRGFLKRFTTAGLR